MGKKLGIVAAIVGGLILLCCLGGGFYARNALLKVQETIKKDEEFVRTAITATAKNWDEKDFAPFADEAFNRPESKDSTRKLFATLKEKLGPLKSLGEVSALKRGGFQTVPQGTNVGFYVRFKVKAKFEKRDGVFDVTVRNNKQRQVISAISLSPEENLSIDSSTSSSNNSP